MDDFRLLTIMNWANTSLRKLKKLSSSKPSLFLAFFSCFAWIYIAGRLWQDAENRTLLANLLQQNYNQRATTFQPKADVFEFGTNQETGMAIEEAVQGADMVFVTSHNDELEAKFFEERAALEAKYQKLYQPLYTKYPFAEATISGDFFEALTSSEFYKNAKVRDISGSFRWLPFLALQSSNSFLTMLLLLSKYRMKSVPVVDLGEGKIENIITQSAVIHMLEECAGLQWFESWGTKSLSELGLPLMKGGRVVKVCEDEPMLQAFKLMRQKGVGAVPVVESGGNKAIANISIRDIQFLLLAPAIYKNHRFSIANKSCWLEPSVNYLTSCIYLGENVVFPVNEGTTPCWLSLKALGRARLGMSKREFLVVAKARKMHSDDFSEIERSGKTWRQDQKVRLQHVETLDYLQSHDKKFSRTAGVSKRFLVKN